MKSLSISIIIPAYNCEEYLGTCISSILGQSFSNFEAIFIDDGSSDGSLPILRDYERKDSRVKVFHKENGGVSSARNLGLSKASGKYVTFVDADDELPSNALSNLYMRMSVGIDLVMGIVSLLIMHFLRKGHSWTHRIF